MIKNRQQLVRQAVEAALDNRWTEAVDLNLILLEQDDHDIPTLNRLSKAYEESEQIDLAKKTLEKVIKIDKYNRIAQNNYSRLKHRSATPIPPRARIVTPTSSSFSFIEEPGKTKTVSLTKLAPHQTISQLRHSQIVKLKANNRHISILTDNGHYLGCLPDDLALHLIKLLKLGYQYEAAIKTVTPTLVDVFLRETKKSARLKGLPSFATKDTKSYYQFLPTEPIAETPLELTDADYSE